MRSSIPKPCFPTMRPVATNVRNVVRMAVTEMERQRDKKMTPYRVRRWRALGLRAIFVKVPGRHPLVESVAV